LRKGGMTINLSDMADNLRLGRIVYDSVRLSPKEEFELGQLVSAQPLNLVARTRLLGHLNKFANSCEGINLEIAASRFEHIRWFVQHIPDSRFCGEVHCYLNSNDPNYESMKEVWLGQIRNSRSLMSSVNAFMYCANGREPNLPIMFELCLSQYAPNPWTEALRHNLSGSRFVFADLIREQLHEQDLCSKEILQITSLANDLRLNKKAAEASSSATKAEFYQSIDRLKEYPVDLESRALVLGYTFSSYLSSSFLGFNPELLITRFEHMCWLICHAAGSELASHAFAMDPLEDQAELNEALTTLWSREIVQNQRDEGVIRNAAIFCAKLGVSPAAEKIIAQLNNTKVGKKHLQRANARF